MSFAESLGNYIKTHDDTDICVYCGKIALPEWLDHPGRQHRGGDMCHEECEKERMEGRQ